MASPTRRSTRKEVFLYAAGMFAAALYFFRESHRVSLLGHSVHWSRHWYNGGEIFVIALGFLFFSMMLLLVGLGIIKGGPEAPQ